MSGEGEGRGGEGGVRRGGVRGMGMKTGAYKRQHIRGKQTLDHEQNGTKTRVPLSRIVTPPQYKYGTNSSAVYTV